MLTAPRPLAWRRCRRCNRHWRPDSARSSNARGGWRRAPTGQELADFDKSAIEQIHRILIETEREELNQLETREKARNHGQTLSSALLGLAGLWMALALVGLYRETVRLIRAGIRAEQTIRQLSLRDPLTGLANRRFLHENEKHLIAGAKRSRKQMAVLVVDLDDFKAVNDRHGHAAGDEVLVTSAERMKQLLREADVIARFGGDEFVIVLEQVDNAAAAREVASRVVESLSQPIPLAGGGTASSGLRWESQCAALAEKRWMTCSGKRTRRFTLRNVTARTPTARRALPAPKAAWAAMPRDRRVRRLPAPYLVFKRLGD